MDSLEQVYVSDIARLTKVAELQRQIIANQVKMIENKDQIIAILTEQKQILTESLSAIHSRVTHADVSLHPELGLD